VGVPFACKRTSGKGIVSATWRAVHHRNGEPANGKKLFRNAHIAALRGYGAYAQSSVMDWHEVDLKWYGICALGLSVWLVTRGAVNNSEDFNEGSPVGSSRRQAVMTRQRD
jgi:hypothetical protein